MLVLALVATAFLAQLEASSTSSSRYLNEDSSTEVMSRLGSRRSLFCETEEGHVLAVGTRRLVAGEHGCVVYECHEGGYLSSKYRDCFPPKCADPVTPRGDCCPICPHGENCRLSTGQIIRKGQSLKLSGKTCSCLKPPEAKCIPEFATSRAKLLAELWDLRGKLRRVLRKLKAKSNLSKLQRMKSQLEMRIRQLENILS